MLLFSRFSILFATPKARYRGLALKFSNTSKRLWSKSIFGKSISKYNFGCPTLNPVYSYMSTKQTMLSALHSASSPPYVVVYCTVPDQATARTISSWLVEKSLAACVNTISGIESTYWWEGKVERDQELLLIIKTKSELVPVVANEIKAKHPYEVPEVISLPIQGGLQGKWTIFSWSPKEMTALEEYLEWIGSSTRNTDESNSSNKA